MKLITRTQAQEILGIKHPITFRLRIAEAGIKHEKIELKNGVQWKYYDEAKIRALAGAQTEGGQ